MRHSKLFSVVLFSSLTYPSGFAQVEPDVSSKALNDHLARAHSKPFAQDKLTSCSGGIQGQRAIGANRLMVGANGDLLFQGVDASGHPWEAQLETAPAAECEVLQADLGGDGREDLVVISYGTNSSGGWDTKLSLLLFDRQGRPFPWQAMGKFHLDDQGVREIVALPGATTASIVVPERQGDAVSGYSYAYKMVQATQDRMVSVHTATWPLLVSPSDEFRKQQALSDLSTKQSVGSSQARVEALVGDNESDARLKTSGGQLVAEPDMLVSDEKDGTRVIDFSPHLADLKRMADHKAMVEQVGRDCDQGECQPLILHAIY